MKLNEPERQNSWQEVKSSSLQSLDRFGRGGRGGAEGGDIRVDSAEIIFQSFREEALNLLADLSWAGVSTL